MQTVSQVRSRLQNGAYHNELSRVYGAEAALARERFLALLQGFCDFYGAGEDTPVCFFSTPGRTEIGGNHTDHQKGRGLAGSVNLDTIACVSPNDSGVIRIQSQNHKMCSITLDTLSPVFGEWGHSPSLVRGVAGRIHQLGYSVGGFDAYTTTRVLRGSGLSSSATFEVLTATILNHLFCGDALSPKELAETAQYAENTYFGKPCGLIDQLSCASGGVISTYFPNGGEVEVQKLSFDLASLGYALCIVDSGVSHAGLHTEYSAIPHEMESVAYCFGRRYLSEVDPALFYENIRQVRENCGDRALLRSMHFFNEDATVVQEVEAILHQDMDTFLSLVRRSGESSYMYLQNIYLTNEPRRQGLAVLLAMAERLLTGKGAYRVHGGGFAGTIQAFVPLPQLASFTAGMESLLGKGCCHVVAFRDTGTTPILCHP